MALKIDTNRSATAFHIVDGAKLFPYAVDAQFAVSHHPLEWSDKPWSPEAAAASREKLGLAAAAALSPEDQAALDEHNKTVADAAKRLEAYHEKKAREKAEADQAAQDEAIVASLPPVPQPVNVRSSQNLSPAQIRKRAAMLDDERDAADKKAADDASAKKGADEKAAADRLANAGAKLTT